MPIPLELSFRNLERSDFITEHVNERCRRLEALCAEITYCHVTIGAPHQHHNKGNHYEVHVELRVPGSELVVAKNTGGSDAHEDLYVAMRDAFEAIERQLNKWKEKRRQEVKAHSRPVQPSLPDEL